MRRQGDQFQELAALFFAMRQIIRAELPGKADPNEWLRMETLRFIDVAGQPTMHQLAAYLRVKAPSVTSLVEHLERAGALKRRQDRLDKRIVRLHLSANGRRQLARHERRTLRVMRSVFSRAGDRKLETLVRILRRLRDIHAPECARRR